MRDFVVGIVTARETPRLARSSGLLLAAGLLALSLIGCALPPPSPSETYVLDASIASRKSAKPGDKVLLVSMPQAQPGYDTARIAYTRAPLSLNYYTKSTWADTPARMLAPLVVRVLENTGGFRAVLSPPAPVSGDLRLDIDIIRFQQEFLEQPSQVRITLRAKLIDTNTFRVLATRVFQAVEPAPSENAYGGVQAANLALGRLLQEIADFVLKHAAEGGAVRKSA